MIFFAFLLSKNKPGGGGGGNALMPAETGLLSTGESTWTSRNRWDCTVGSDFPNESV